MKIRIVKPRPPFLPDWFFIVGRLDKSGVWHPPVYFKYVQFDGTILYNDPKHGIVEWI